ncbi:MAG: signal peptide peptidase SppA [candidate division FCPU426 bacterium]
MTSRHRDLLLLAGGLAGFGILMLLALLSLARMSGGYVGLVQIEGVLLEDRTAVKQLHRLRDHPRVKAVVIHLNTPGGTLASAQSIAEEISKLRRSGIPVVASMAEICASAGYFISCAADRSLAAPGSITGSIGAILRYPEAGELMRKIGVRMEVVKSGDYKDMGDFSRPLTASEKRLLQDMLDDLHAQFVDMVLNARGDKLAAALAKKRGVQLTDLAPEEVKAELLGLADGRVFSGRQAQALGLVDQLGNLDDAVETAARLAGLRGKPRVWREKPPSLWQQWLQASPWSGGSRSTDWRLDAIKAWLRQWLQAL